MQESGHTSDNKSSSNIPTTTIEPIQPTESNKRPRKESHENAKISFSIPEQHLNRKEVELSFSRRSRRPGRTDHCYSEQLRGITRGKHHMSSNQHHQSCNLIIHLIKLNTSIAHGSTNIKHHLFVDIWAESCQKKNLFTIYSKLSRKPQVLTQYTEPLQYYRRHDKLMDTRRAKQTDGKLFSLLRPLDTSL